MMDNYIFIQALSRAEEEKLDILTQIGHVSCTCTTDNPLPNMNSTHEQAVIKQKDAQKGGIKKSQSQ